LFGLFGLISAFLIIILLLTYLGGVIFGNMDELDEDF
jgi:predicted lipid-binding transport protein (Tim44 family)